MDEISDNTFIEVHGSDVSNDDPSLLTIVLEVSPEGWFNIKDQTSIMDVVKSLLVFLNGHLSLNNSNQVAFVLSSPAGSKFLYPDTSKTYEEIPLNVTSEETVENSNKSEELSFVTKGMYRQFRVVDETVLSGLSQTMSDITHAQDDKVTGSSRLSGALSLALSYTNRMMKLDQSISTTTASAISSAANISNKESSTAGASSGTNANSYGTSRMKSRILVVTPNDNEDIKYISLMKAIFGAQKMKVAIDIAKLGRKDSSYLQQAADATNGVYLHIEKPLGLIQVLCTAYFIEPSIRPLMILPTNSNVNYKASCFITGKSVEIGYVCSVCLCIMSEIPDRMSCPTCNSHFDEKLIAKLKRKPVVKKRKLDNGSSESSTPAPEA
ncbi:transcription factor Tfb4 [Yamadazyma tenuis ATCC 10573]|uniref:General transcription and DNA repair factor IIH subunit TFB4 n=1 Tax=Candida tenuis (strain ATCC 10573 / BCRC 21748 / CBS 615 / JCM 9827 / NBRC 10315 / NRRL Y-1498 / VKM Y-70) TaxID=590646 RepID=G3BBK7_CANTC|nr:transcription factor Tfb4 [Yamadazyma tenuis ATCC 10573]EGV61560.1 transcription factor Tfb4 [Yamadazyma tenuis ATCC 10573]